MLDREMGVHVLFFTLVLNVFLYEEVSLCQNRGWHPEIPFLRLVQMLVQNGAEHGYHQLLDMSLQVVSNSQ